jgi:hypothetical protein
VDDFGKKFAGKVPPQLVIASKRNGAYADDIQLALDAYELFES